MDVSLKIAATIKKICEDNFGKIQVFKNQLLKDDVTIVIKKLT